MENWRKVLERHIEIYKMDKIRIIYKTGDITITLYTKPKKDPRSKLHIQGKSQDKNLNFILENLALFYKEVCETVGKEIEFRDLRRSICGKCGKSVVNKKGVKHHMIRMHTSTSRKIKQSVPSDAVLLKPSPEESNRKRCHWTYIGGNH